ncbi:MAG: potassium transporter [Proteobacteria bacterium]|nr:potassium transporter [Pseudomonadota bacterium]
MSKFCLDRRDRARGGLEAACPSRSRVFYGDGDVTALLISAGTSCIFGLAAFYFTKIPDDIRPKEGFAIVTFGWLAAALFGSLPFYLSGAIPSFVDCFFETMSGFTTTGASILTDIESLPRGVLFWRSLTQWLGGMGIIVLAVAVLPMLGVGGMQLYRAETPGPVKDNKLTPRITQTAKALYFIYAGITVACFAAYWIAGMDWFDALGHAFSTVAIGGFSTHDASIGHYAQIGHPNALAIEMIAVVFMLIGAANFSLHFLAWKNRSIKSYLQDPEFRAMITILLTVTAITVFYLFASGYYGSFAESMRKGLFQAVSIGTTTGFTTAKYSMWPGSLPVMLLLVSFIGGCAGSTGGGMKVIRWLLIYKQGAREVLRLIHPSAEIPVKLGNTAVPTRVIEAVWGFFSIYIVMFAVMMLVLMMTGLDQNTAFSAIAATLNNLGPGLGTIGPTSNYAHFSWPAKVLFTWLMMIGRLEIFAILLPFMPSFWRSR